MDGSRRSGHSNAFFTGFGRFRHIVLFDTLMAQLAPEEVEAVLAHEIGHYKCGHVPKALALTAVLQFAAFAAIAWLARIGSFNAAFGLPPHGLAPTFLLVGLAGGLVTFWFAPAANWLSRRNEYEADAFAMDAVGSSAPMTGALRKLSRENLSNLTPHPIYSMVYYSHPTLVERERALSGRARSVERRADPSPASGA
jgi:STE24 endopeptidase